MKAILLHHAGGDKYAFRDLQQWLSPGIETRAIELPGRGDRFSEKLLYDADGMVTDLFQQVEEDIKQDYFLVGMSMGAVLAFLLTHKLKQMGLPLPKHLFLAARLPFQHYETKEDLHALSGDDFWKFIVEYDERSSPILGNKELREFFEPIVKADFLAMQHFDKRFIGLPKLEVPCSVIYGEDDKKMFDPEKAKEWNDYFVEAPEQRFFKGGHFFIYENPDVADYIKSIVMSN